MNDEELIRGKFEEDAHEVFGDATEFLEKRVVLGGLTEYVRGDVNASWIFYKFGYERGRACAGR